MTEHSPPDTPMPTAWENLDQALSRLESAILTHKQNDATNKTTQLLRQNAHLKATLRQALAELKTILNS